MTHALPTPDAPRREIWLKRDPDLEKGPVSGFSFDAIDVHAIPPHAHQRAQLTHVLRGVVVFSIGRTSWTLPPLRAIWIPAGLMHHARYPRGAEMRSLFFDETSLNGEAPREVQVYQLDELSRALLREATELDWGDAPGRTESMTLDLLRARLRARSDPGVHLPGGSDPRLHRVMCHMRERPRDNATLDELARIAVCSRRTLARLFNEETGMAPALWRRQMRMGLALEMLASDVPISRIAWELGYSTAGNFTVAFKAAFGTTPSHYFL